MEEGKDGLLSSPQPSLSKSFTLCAVAHPLLASACQKMKKKSDHFKGMKSPSLDGFMNSCCRHSNQKQLVFLEGSRVSKGFLGGEGSEITVCVCVGGVCVWGGRGVPM